MIFPEDTSRWREDSRTVRVARPDQHGEFSIKGLPPGKYLIAAVDYVQEGQWYDPEFLAELGPARSGCRSPRRRPSASV